MYMMIRFLLGIVLCAIPVVLTDKIPKRRSIPLAIMVFTAFSFSAANLPVENYFYTFHPRMPAYPIMGAAPMYKPLCRAEKVTW